MTDTEDKPTGLRHPETPAVTKIRAIQARKGWKDEVMADYLGVPVTTLRNWLGLHRRPPAVVDRLLTVMGMVEAMNPTLHEMFVP